ncbi:MAG: winged helix-turn-helix domain-containing protein, partial [Patescibacteria group bacterium]|nr:winged helix-turn-helix domain-containing protein [Patescibacteria group bacterium]
RYDRLKEVISQRRLYFPLFSSKEALFSLQRRMAKYNLKLPSALVPEIINLSGGHPSLLKVCLRVGSEQFTTKTTKEEMLVQLSNFQEIKMIFCEIWSSLTKQEQTSLRVMADFPGRLMNLGIIRLEKGQFKVFSPLFENYLKNLGSKAEKIAFNEKTGELLVNSLAIGKNLTLNEYRLLSNFVREKNKIFTKDEIAEILWGEESYEKYSDWAIDKVLSQLRRKLKAIGIDGRSLQSIRNRGYCWRED